MGRSFELGPVVGLAVYRQDVVIKRAGACTNPQTANKKPITELSYESRRRLAFVACNAETTWRTMVTLTYPAVYPCDGRRVKKHLHAFLIWLKYDTRGTGYLWFLEFQKRGAPHIHILLDFPFPSVRGDAAALRFRVSASWYRIVDSGDRRHLAAGTRVERIRKAEGGARYATKYAFKCEQKQVPEPYQNVGRFWGCSRDIAPKPRFEAECTEDDVRGVLQGWRYCPASDKPVYKVLWNVGDRFRAWVAADRVEGRVI